MPRRRSAYLVPPAHCQLERLPAELLHRIFSFLEVSDVTAARATCSLLAAVGGDYILEEVAVIFQRDRFRRLLAIAHHPVFAQRVKALFFQGDRFSSDPCYDEWDDSRSDPNTDGRMTDDLPGVEPSGSGRYMRAIGRALTKWKDTRKGNFTEEELDAAFDAYVWHINSQKRIVAEGYDTFCLTALLNGCPKLRCITLAFQQAMSGKLAMTTNAFRDAMDYPKGDTVWEDQGVRQVTAISQAVCLSGQSLDSLSLIEVSHRVFEQSRDVVERIRHMFRPLRRLRLLVQTWATDEDLVAEEQQLFEASLCFEGGAVKEVLKDTPDLRVLKLQFPIGVTGPGIQVVARLGDITGDTTWPNLLELGLSNFIATEDGLVDLLLRHRTSLRWLSLSHIELESGTWTSALRRIAGKLSNLRSIRLRSYFVSDASGREFDFDIPGAESRKIAPLRDAVETYILKGGEYPNVDRLPLLLSMYPWEEPEYVSPGIPIDEPDPEDPALRYEWDQFDAHM
ncbi:hypothetical protein LTR85_007429 [Meristemomyces frigidus]|nr:hypothetical protein LTR85_007429 [Meristemomyces frigidus]